MRAHKRLLLTLSALLTFAVPSFATDTQQPLTAPLPPLMPWNGKSRALVAKAQDPWITPSEKSGFRTTPSYDETVAWLRRLMAATPDLRMISIGKSAEGRDILIVIASATGSGAARRRVSSLRIVPVRDPSPRSTAPATHRPRGSAGSEAVQKSRTDATKTAVARAVCLSHRERRLFLTQASRKRVRGVALAGSRLPAC